MHRILTATAIAGLLATAPAVAVAAVQPTTRQVQAPPSPQQIDRLLDRARQSRYLWATVNECQTAHPGGTIGIRGEMPGLGIPATLTLTIRLNYFSATRHAYVPLPGATSTQSVTLGPFTGTGEAHQGGASFPFSANAGRLNASVTFTWSRGDTRLGTITETTSAGHPQAAYAQPVHFSAAACRLG